MKKLNLSNLRRMAISTGSAREPEEHEIIVAKDDVDLMVEQLEDLNKNGGINPFSKFPGSRLILVQILVFPFLVRDDGGTPYGITEPFVTPQSVWPRPRS